MSDTMRKNLLKEFRDRDFIRVCRSLMDAPDRSGITSLKGLAAAAPVSYTHLLRVGIIRLRSNCIPFLELSTALFDGW